MPVTTPGDEEGGKETKEVLLAISVVGRRIQEEEGAGESRDGGFVATVLTMRDVLHMRNCEWKSNAMRPLLLVDERRIIVEAIVSQRLTTI